MFLRNLLNKITNLFDKDDLKSIFINNFREIIIIVVSIWVIILIIVLFGIMSSKKVDNSISKIPENSNKDKELAKRTNDELLLNSDDFILSESYSYDLTNDYVNLLPKKKYELPGKRLIIKVYNKLSEQDINESLKFNFEKRRSVNKE